VRPAYLLTLVPALLLAAPGLAGEPDAAGQFAATCGACHMPDGSGIPGLAPPLADGALWEGLAEDAPTYVAGVILSGLAGTIEAGGQTYAGLVMPSHARLSDETIAALGTYVLTRLNDTGHALDPEAVATLRENPPGHADLIALRKGQQ